MCPKYLIDLNIKCLEMTREFALYSVNFDFHHYAFLGLFGIDQFISVKYFENIHYSCHILGIRHKKNKIQSKDMFWANIYLLWSGDIVLYCIYGNDTDAKSKLYFRM